MELLVYLAEGCLVFGIAWVLTVFDEAAPVHHQLMEGVKRSAKLIDAIYGTPLH
ncbi:hypothetical protein [Variovorax soli]|uniref:Regulator of extracellular matrix RemA (YlzA/DUF370 family) n=1 Tax=Variovorax soli TaxID=376815 RepID=A0ABU1NMJ3_9BURK|nr:hypothetical protein [Variovorax soli]MDR6539667.1 regulator of extracellular matrix RemA (YlzA/DUF370 family) [Variovorax soli]